MNNVFQVNEGLFYEEWPDSPVVKILYLPLKDLTMFTLTILLHIKRWRVLSSICDGDC